MHTQWAEAALYRSPRRGSLAQHITDQLRRRIVTGDLVPGRRLPSVRKLAHLYRVSVPTMESAVHALVALGFVRVSRGVGTFVAFPNEQMTLLNYVWRAASPLELAITRVAIDERAAPLVAAAVRDEPRSRLPRTLQDINFLVHERSANRTGDPETFTRSDLAFHRTVVASLRGMELGPALYARVSERLMTELMPVADVQAADDVLNAAHLRLAAAILSGDVGGAARCARHVALRELRSLEKTLG